MMPYCARDPPSHYLAGQLHPHSSLETIAEDNSSSSAKIDHATPFHLWRWRIPAVMAICTLLLFLTNMVSAFTDALPTGVGSCVLHQANKSSGESEFSGWSTTSNDAKKTSHELVLRRSTKYSMEYQQFRNRELKSMYKLQSLSNFHDPQQVAKPRSRRSRQGVGTGRLTFSNRRILVSSVCTNKDISIFQSPDGSSGIPRYAVQIMNNCMSDCPPSDIHVFCGWFASALLVNPNSFKRIAFNDCLVNGGKPLRHGETLRFTYANSFMYPLRFKSASFCK